MFISPYELSKEAGVRPQMIYNYVKKGWIVATPGPTGKLQVSREEADRWLEKYRTSKEEKLQKLLAELEGR